MNLALSLFANAIWNYKLFILSKCKNFDSIFFYNLVYLVYLIHTKSIFLAVTTVFKTEIPVLSRFSIHTGIFAWDQKYFIIISYFRLHNTNEITSLALSRILFKGPNGKTFKPEQMFEAAGYFKDESKEEKEERENKRQTRMKIIEGIHRLDQLFDETFARELNLDKMKGKVPAKL